MPVVLDDGIDSTPVVCVSFVSVCTVISVAFLVISFVTPIIVDPTVGEEDCGKGVDNSNKYNASILLVRLADMLYKEELNSSSLLVSDTLHVSTVFFVMFAARVVIFSNDFVSSAIDSKLETSPTNDSQVIDLFLLSFKTVLTFSVTSSTELSMDDKVDIFSFNCEADSDVVISICLVLIVFAVDSLSKYVY